MDKQYFEKMKMIAWQGGDLSLRMMADMSHSLKEDQSVLTQADMAVSALAKERLQDLLKTKDHILIDEEDEKKDGHFDQALLDKTPYVWAVDPIDGTRSFSNHLPTFGVSIGLLKELKPWMGMVYFPRLKELFTCDGKEAYFVREAFTAQEKRVKIVPVDQNITRQSIFFGNDIFLKGYDWDHSFCSLMQFACAVVDICWPSIGRGCGAFFKSSLWDFAGSWPVARCAGLEFRNLDSGKVLDRIHTDLFMGQGLKTWRLKAPHILSSERNFPLIRDRIRLRPGAA